MNKRILFIPNMPFWALDKNAKDIIKYNTSDIEFNIAYFPDFKENWQKYYEEYDLLFPMYINLFFAFQNMNLPLDKAITGIRSFHSWDNGKTLPPGYNVRPPRNTIKRLSKALLINTQCKKLWYIFSQHLPVVHTKYTCDLETFYPENSRHNDKLVVGWAGSLTNHGEKRGFYDYIKPACEAVKEIELKVQAAEDNFITNDNQMRDFYNSLDLYICASRSEGGPRPVLEAAACGVPSVTTDVGLVPELIDHDVNGFIVDRRIEAFVDKLAYYINNRDKLKEMGKAAHLKMEQEFNWKDLIYQWIDFFKYALELSRLKDDRIIK